MLKSKLLERLASAAATDPVVSSEPPVSVASDSVSVAPQYKRFVAYKRNKKPMTAAEALRQQRSHCQNYLTIDEAKIFVDEFAIWGKAFANVFMLL